MPKCGYCKAEVKKIALFCILAALLIVIAGCDEQPTKISSQRIDERPVSPPQIIEPAVEVNETENETVEANESAVQEKTSRYRPVKAVVEDASEEVFNESAYLRINLSDITKNRNLQSDQFDNEIRLNAFLSDESRPGRDLINESIVFTATIKPLPLSEVLPNHTVEAAVLLDNNTFLFLFPIDLVNNFSLFCNFTNFVANCDNFEMHGEYNFYGVLREQVTEEYGVLWYNQKLELHKLIQIDAPKETILAIENGYTCNSATDCDWISTNCCTLNSGAYWQCVDKNMKEYLCFEERIWGCDEVYRPKPSSSCTCQEGKCIAG